MNKTLNGLTLRRRSRHAMDMCLCPRCAQQFYDSPAFFIKRRDLFQIEKDLCTFCSYGSGYDFRVYSILSAAQAYSPQSSSTVYEKGVYQHA